MIYEQIDIFTERYKPSYTFPYRRYIRTYCSHINKLPVMLKDDSATIKRKDK
jgi:hypothetical protein